MNNAALRLARDALLANSLALVTRALARFVGLPVDKRTVPTVAKATKRVVDTARSRGRDLAYRDYVQVVRTDPVPRLELNRFNDALWDSVIDRLTNEHEEFTEDLAIEIALNADHWIRDAITGQRIDSAKKDPRVGRIARVDWNPPACPFCTLLNSRGPVYLTEESALNTLHNGDECDLVFVPRGTEDDYPGRESTLQSEAAYKQAVKDAETGSTSDILKALSAQQPDRPPGRVLSSIKDTLAQEAR